MSFIKSQVVSTVHNDIGKRSYAIVIDPRLGLYAGVASHI